MSSLSNCIRLHGASLSEADVTDLKQRSADYLAEGYGPGKSSVLALDDVIQEAIEEKNDIVAQIVDQRPDLVEEVTEDVPLGMESWQVDLGLMGVHTYKPSMPPPVPAGGKIISSKIFPRKIKITKRYAEESGYPREIGAYRISVVENAEGKRYSQSEVMTVDRSSPTGIIAEFTLLGDRVEDSEFKAVNNAAAKMFEEAKVPDLFRVAVGPAKETKGSEPKKTTKIAAAEKKTDITEDVGKELVYNKRNWVSKGLSWSDIKDQDVALRVKQVTKAKVYPRPDYQAMIDSGMQPVIAHVVKQAYDSLSTKPQVSGVPTDEQLEQYIKAVNNFMDGVLSWASDKDEVLDWITKISQSAKIQAGAMSGQPTDIMSMMDKAPEPGKGLLESVFPGGWKEHRSDLGIIGGNKTLQSIQPFTGEAVKALKDIDKGWPKPQEAWQKRGFKIIPGDNIRVEYYSGKGSDDKPYTYVSVYQGSDRILSHSISGAESKADPAVIKFTDEITKELTDKFLLLDKGNRLIDAYETKDQALEGAREQTKPAKRKKQVSEKGISVLAAERKGPPRRKEGKDISSKKLMDTFKFKGINFGNWMKGKSNEAERQLHLNHAYDSFLDLADLLNVPPEAMSLNGLIGIAFGAQGTGSNAAHFVPGFNEINLTRTSGAGSLAHEFAHALDHHFGRQAGFERATDPYLSAYVNMSHRMKDSKIRPEIADKFRTIVIAMIQRDKTAAEEKADNENYTKRVTANVKSWADSIKSRFLSQATAGLNVQINGKDVPFVDAVEDIFKRIEKGDYGDGKVTIRKGRTSYEMDTVMDPVVVELRDIYKKAFGRAFQIKDLKALQSNIDSLEYQKKNKKQTSDHIPQVSTEYLKEARILDRETGKKQGGKAYWSQNLEMFARAFDAYVSDTLQNREIKNTYLSHADRGGETVPQGAERIAINKAFDELIAEIKYRKTEKGTELYSKSPSRATTDSTVEEIEAGVDDILTAKGRKNLGIKVVPSLGGTIQASFDKGIITLAANKITPEGVWPFILHESAHKVKSEQGWKGLFGRNADEILADIDKKIATGDKGWVAAQKKAIDAKTSAEDMREETISYFLANNANKNQSLWRRIVNAIRSWALRVGIKRKPSDADIIGLAEYAVMKAAAAGPGRVGAGMLALDPMFSDNPLWHSTLVRAVNNLSQEKGSPDQMLAMIKKAPGVKQEEIDWIGFEEWMKGKKSVTKQEIGDYLAANAVQVEEVVKGEPSEGDIDIFLEDEMGEGQTREEAREFLRGEEGRPKFTDYQLPGGENYKELLLTLPDLSKDESLVFTNWAEREKGLSKNEVSAELVSEGAIYQEWKRDVQPKAIAAGETYTGGHYEEPNVLAHVRFNERTDADGKSVLFIEEIQSDWHQAGRKRGYDVLSQKEFDRLEELEGISVQERELTENEQTELDSLEARAGSEYQQRGRAGRGVPDAPFKKTWPLLTMKRMIRYAAENGFDKLAWTPGEIQNKRYDLSQHISEIRYEQDNDGSDNYDVEAKDHNGNLVIDDQDVTLAGIEEIFGKEIAEKIKGNKGEDESTSYRNWFSLSGADFQVGGEGMIGFYDKMLPSFVNKFVKKFGAKVGKTDLGKIHGFEDQETMTIGKVHSLTITPELKKAALSSMPMFSKDVKYSVDIASDFTADKTTPWINKFDPKWKDRWERLVYFWADRDDPKRLIQNRYGKQDEASNYLMAERLRGSKAVAETKRFSQEEVNPLLDLLANNDLEIADEEEYSMVKHVPERNKQMRRINARQYLNTIASIKIGAESEEVRFNIANADSNIDKEDRRDDYLDLLNQEFSGLDQRGTKIAAKRKELENRKFSLEEHHKDTPATLEKKQASAERRHQQLLDQRESWEDRSTNFAGMTDEESIEILNKWKADKRFKAVEKGRKMLAKINDGRLVDLVEGGEMTEQQANLIRSTYKYYVPFNREGFVDSRPSSGRSTGPLGKPIKGAVGSQRRVIDIFANSVANRQESISRKHKALVGQKLYQLVKDNPDPGNWWIEETPTKFGHDQDGNVIRIAENEEPKNGIPLKIDGRRYTVMVNHEDPTMMRMVQSVKDVDVGMGPIVNALSKITRLLASLNTVWSPEFIGTNFFRDLGTAGVNIEDSEAKGAQVKIAKNIPAAIKGIFTAERGKDSKWGDIYRDFEKQGAKIGWMQSYENVADLAKELSEEMKLYQEGNTTKKSLRKLSDLLEASNVAVENGVRLATYDYLVNTKGINKREAAMAVKNLTVDFTRRGAAGPNLNALYMFANAGIQGNIRMMKAAVRSSKVRKMLGAIVGTGFAMHFLALAMGGDDEDDIPFFDKVPDSEKERNMIFMRSDGKKIKIPMPYGYNIFFNLGDELAKMVATNMSGKNYSQIKGMSRLATVFMNTFNPVASSTLLQTIMPTVGDPIAMIAENKTWFGGDLMPKKSPYGISKPDSQRFWKSVSPQSKFIAQSLNKLTGGDTIKGGWVDVSPESLDLLIDTYTGSAGRFVKDTANLPIRMAKGELETRKIPFVRRFAGEQFQGTNASIYRERVQDVLTLYEQVKIADPEEKTRLKTDNRFRIILLARATEKRLRKLSKIRNSKEAQGKSADLVKAEINKIRTRFVQKYEEVI